jgi:hypothetical protein
VKQIADGFRGIGIDEQDVSSRADWLDAVSTLLGRCQDGRIPRGRRVFCGTHRIVKEFRGIEPNHGTISMVGLEGREASPLRLEGSEASRGRRSDNRTGG